MKDTLTKISGISAVIFTVATIFTLKSGHPYYFLLPTLAILSLLVMFGLNVSKFRMSESERKLALDEIFTKTYAEIPVMKRVQAVTVYASVFFIASIALLILASVTDSQIISFFLIALFTPMYALTPTYKVFFSRPIKYLVSITIAVIWALVAMLCIEVFSIRLSNSVLVMMVTVILLIVLSELAKYLALKTTGVKLPSI